MNYEIIYNNIIENGSVDDSTSRIDKSDGKVVKKLAFYNFSTGITNTSPTDSIY